MDEMVDGAGRIRPHWRNLLGAVGGLGKPQLEERARRLQRAAEEEGIASILPHQSGGHGAPPRSRFRRFVPASESG